MITIPVSIGELIDKLSILHIKQNKINETEKLGFIKKEFDLLYDKSLCYLENKEINNLYEILIKINTKLWEIENNLRDSEKNKIFDFNFIELSRQVYQTNDERFLAKNKINELTNSIVREQKDYVKY